LPAVVRILLVVEAALYLAVVIARELPFLDSAMLTAEGVSSGQVWRLLTHLPFHARPDAFGALFDLAVLWSLGGMFGQRWRQTHFLFFYVTAGVVGGLAHVGAGTLWPAVVAVPYLGSHAPSFALLTAFWVVFGEMPVSMFGSPPFKGKWVFFALAGLEIVLFASGSNPIFFVQAGGVLGGWLMLTGRWRPAKLKAWLRDLGRRKERSRFRVIH
jgi:membrane associated rhomboid family serine protease